MPIIRRFSSFVSFNAAGAATMPIGLPSTLVTVNMAGATGHQTVVLPSANNYAGQEVGVQVKGAVATQTVIIQSPAGTTIDTFPASTNGSRSYVYNGFAYQ